VLVPFVDYDGEWNAKPYYPRFPHVVWERLFHDLIPAELRQAPMPSAKGRRTATQPATKREAARVSEDRLERWMKNDWLPQLEKEGRSATQRAAWAAAKDKFGEDKVTRVQAYAALDNLRPGRKPGPRGPRKLTPK